MMLDYWAVEEITLLIFYILREGPNLCEIVVECVVVDVGMVVIASSF